MSPTAELTVHGHAGKQALTTDDGDEMPIVGNGDVPTMLAAEP